MPRHTYISVNRKPISPDVSSIRSLMSNITAATEPARPLPARYGTPELILLSFIFTPLAVYFPLSSYFLKCLSGYAILLFLISSFNTLLPKSLVWLLPFTLTVKAPENVKLALALFLLPRDYVSLHCTADSRSSLLARGTARFQHPLTEAWRGSGRRST